MPQGLLLKSKNALASSAPPVYMGDVRQMFPADAISTGSPATVTVEDRFSGDIWAPAAQANSPTIGSTGGVPHLAFASGQGFVDTASKMLQNMPEWTIYLPVLITAQGVSAPALLYSLNIGGQSASVIVRRVTSMTTWQFQVDFGAVAATALTLTPVLNAWTIITVGCSALNNQLVFGFDETETTGSASAQTWGQTTETALLEYFRKNDGSANLVGLSREIKVCGAYHSASQRAQMRAMIRDNWANP